MEKIIYLLDDMGMKVFFRVKPIPSLDGNVPYVNPMIEKCLSREVKVGIYYKN